MVGLSGLSGTIERATSSPAAVSGASAPTASRRTAAPAIVASGVLGGSLALDALDLIDGDGDRSGTVTSWPWQAIESTFSLEAAAGASFSAEPPSLAPPLGLSHRWNSPPNLPGFSSPSSGVVAGRGEAVWAALSSEPSGTDSVGSAWCDLIIEFEGRPRGLELGLFGVGARDDDAGRGSGRGSGRVSRLGSTGANFSPETATDHLTCGRSAGPSPEPPETRVLDIETRAARRPIPSSSPSLTPTSPAKSSFGAEEDTGPIRGPLRLGVTVGGR